MPKTKKIDSRRQLFRYSPEAVKNALEAIENGMPVLTASKTFGVPRSTLRHKVAGRAPLTSGKVGPECVLGNDVELALVNWLKYTAEAGFPINKDGLRYSVKEIIEYTNISNPFKDKTPGKKWFASFFKRHPELSIKKAEYLSKSKSKITPEIIHKWFEKTYELLGENAIILNDSNRVWNMDETAFFLNPDGNYVIAEKGKNVYGTSNNNDKENITTLIAVNANGLFAPPLTLYKFSRLPVSYIKAAPPHWGIGKSKNGWMTAQNFYEYFTNVFYPFLKEKNIALPVIVFLDGHRSHCSLPLAKFCREKEIILVCLFPNTTHILQPLDVSVFSPLKKYWKREVRKWKYSHSGKEIQKHEVPILLNQILTDNSFKDKIENGFRVCGLYPFNAENVDYTKCTVKPSSPSALESTNPQNRMSNVERNTDFLPLLESNIDNVTLDDFKLCKQYNLRPVNEKAEMLYDVWLKFLPTEQSEQNGETAREVEDVLEISFPEFNYNSSDDDADEYVMRSNLASRNETDSNSNGLDPNCSSHEEGKEEFTEQRREKSSENCQEKSFSTQSNTAISNNSEVETGRTKQVVNILENILIYPEENTSDLKKPNKKHTKEKTPSVLTSDQWIAIAEKKEEEKQEVLKKKEDRKRKREEEKIKLKNKNVKKEKLVRKPK